MITCQAIQPKDIQEVMRRYSQNIGPFASQNVSFVKLSKKSNEVLDRINYSYIRNLRIDISQNKYYL